MQLLYDYAASFPLINWSVCLLSVGLTLFSEEARSYNFIAAYLIRNHSQVEVLDIVLPDWAWVVIFGGAISLAIIAMFGCVVGCNRYNIRRINMA